MSAEGIVDGFRRAAALLVLITLACYVGCHSSSTRPQDTHIFPSNENNLVSTIKDEKWEFKLLSKLPDESEQKRIRCRQDGLCWVWSSQSIWIAEPGGTWQMFYTETSKTDGSPSGIRSVHFVSPNTCWVVSETNMLLKSADGGQSWSNVPIPGIDGRYNGDVFSVYFENENHGWVAGGRYEPRRPNESGPNYALDHDRILVSCVLETTDGGVTWNASTIPPQRYNLRPVGGFDEIYSWSSEIGVASDQDNCVFTNNGGKTWTDLTHFFPVDKSDPDPISLEFVSAFFLDSTKGWAVFARTGFDVLATNNSGQSWKHATWKLASDSNDTSHYPPESRFIFVDDRHGLFVYNHTEGGELFKTSDAGRTWKKIPADASNHQTFYDIFYNATSGGLLVSDKGIYSFSLKRIGR